MRAAVYLYNLTCINNNIYYIIYFRVIEVLPPPPTRQTDRRSANVHRRPSYCNIVVAAGPRCRTCTVPRTVKTHSRNDYGTRQRAVDFGRRDDTAAAPDGGGCGCHLRGDRRRQRTAGGIRGRRRRWPQEQERRLAGRRGTRELEIGAARRQQFCFRRLSSHRCCR